MKILLCGISLLLAASLAAQPLVNVQKTGAPANAISGDLVFPTGRTLTLASGSHLSLAAGTFSPSAGSIAWAALTGQPTTIAGYGITDPIVLTSGSYADPSWITSFNASKLTGSLAAARFPAFTGDATSSAGTVALTLAASGVTAGSYGSATQAPVVTFDAKGRATGVTLATIAPLFSNVASKPTTAAGYGITNGATIDSWGSKTVPSGTVADLSSVQVFTNKSVSGAANTITNVPLGTAVTGTLLAANFPALTGDVTTSAGSLATTYAGIVPAAKGGAGAVTGILKANGSGVVSAAVAGTDYAAPGSFLTSLTGDVTATGPGAAAATVVKINGTTLSGLATGLLKNTTGTGVPSIAAAGVDYQTPLTISTGLTNSGGTVTVNTSQNVAKLSNLTSNGFVKTSGGDGTLSVDTSTYITGNQTITVSGDATGSGTTSIALTNTKLNGVSLAGLATGILKNATSTGVPSIAAAGTDYVAPGGAGAISGLTANGAVYGASSTTVASTAALTNGQLLIGSTSASPVRGTLTGTANELTVTNGAGAITLSLPSALTFTGKTVTGGIFAATSFDGPVGSNTPSSGTFTALNATSVGGTTPGTGAFTTLNSTGGAFNGTVGATTRASGAFTTLNSTVTGGVNDVTFSSVYSVGNNYTTSLLLRGNTVGNNDAAQVSFVNDYSGNTGSARISFDKLELYSEIDGVRGWVVTAAGGAAIKGTTTNDAAAAGYVGQYVTATASAASVSLTTGVSANITSISLTAGDWDVSGQVIFTSASGTTVTQYNLDVSATSATLLGNESQFSLAGSFVGAFNQFFNSGLQRLSLATTTTVYLVANSSFSVSTLTAGGTIRARRVR